MWSYLLIAVGLALLAAGGELLVRGSAQLAARFGVSSLAIGLTVVAFGTSAPELAVSLQSLGSGAADLALGNVVGSNIFNILFVLGLSALIAPLAVSRRVIRVEVPVVIAVSMLSLALAWNGRIGVAEGVLLLAVVMGYTTWLLRTSREEPPLDEDVRGTAAPSPVLAAIVVGLAGLVLLVLGARWLVEGSVDLARRLGVDDVVIGLTLVAAGTSLPEVAASVTATLRGHRDMAIGNVLGSCTFNLTVILGTTSVAAGGLSVSPGVVSFDFVIMLATAVACLPIFHTGYKIKRWEGLVFVLYYAAYTGYLVLDATDHQRLPRFQHALTLFALPLTAITLVVLSAHSEWRRRRARARG